MENPIRNGMIWGCLTPIFRNTHLTSFDHFSGPILWRWKQPSILGILPIFWKQPSRNNPTFASFGVPFSRLRLASRRARYDEALGLNQKRWKIGKWRLSVYQKNIQKHVYIYIYISYCFLWNVQILNIRYYQLSYWTFKTKTPQKPRWWLYYFSFWVKKKFAK